MGGQGRIGGQERRPGRSLQPERVDQGDCWERLSEEDEGDGDPGQLGKGWYTASPFGLKITSGADLAAQLPRSQGAVVDSHALAEALDQGQLFAAGVDVVDGEPNIEADHPLARQPRCVVLPHIGSATWDAREGMAMLCKSVSVGRVMTVLVAESLRCDRRKERSGWGSRGRNARRAEVTERSLPLKRTISRPTLKIHLIFKLGCQTYIQAWPNKRRGHKHLTSPSDHPMKSHSTHYKANVTFLKIPKDLYPTNE